ncbi:hypothetical protein JG687_00015008 [Phytophthora cactorum]|uniref:Uncharacterized protein n=1 Tax=Phytophthora cactorum TaxID=29920 RepID=A0A8T1TX47_9STRA|nr:hypothetical protein JG687_00015008 [Phytophthora cactorum]
MVCGEEGAVRVTECMCPVGGFKIEVVSCVRLVSTCGSQRQLDENHVSLIKSSSKQLMRGNWLEYGTRQSVQVESMVLPNVVRSKILIISA